MTKIASRSVRLGALIAAAALALTGCASTATPAATTAAAAKTQAESVTITDAWVKSAESGMSAAFGMLENTGDVEANVVAVTTEASTMLELHETVDDGTGAMVMQEEEGGFVLPAGGMLALEPGGNHIMLMDLTAPLMAGEETAFELEFADGSTLEFTAPVKDYSGANEEYVEGEMDHGDDHTHGEGEEDHDH